MFLSMPKYQKYSHDSPWSLFGLWVDSLANECSLINILEQTAVATKMSGSGNLIDWFVYDKKLILWFQNKIDIRNLENQSHQIAFPFPRLFSVHTNILSCFRKIL